jgi:glycosyltransferase involved in cell wall biosynthesis
MRILLVSHAWPFPQAGGAEVAALNLAAALRSEGHQVQLAACVPGLDEETGYDTANDMVLVRSATHPRSYVWTDPATARVWERLIESFAPDIVHLHHYVNAGAELALVAKRAAPRAKVILTLHEYLAICPQDGQMFTSSGQLCTGAAVRKCASCVGTTPAAIAHHASTLQALFRYVDRFIAPSRFLKQRYIDWGLAAERIEYVPNVVASPSPVVRAPAANRPVRFVFMSQHTPYKGLDVLLEALQYIEERHPEATKHALVDVWGSGIERFGPEWTERIDGLKSGLGPWVSFRGAYQPRQTGQIYATADWTIVPSIWWENRPLVIEESLSNRVPVLASGIGGMAELVCGPERGRTFEPGDPVALATAILHALDAPPTTVEYSAAIDATDHLRLYSSLGPQTDTAR